MSTSQSISTTTTTTSNTTNTTTNEVNAKLPTWGNADKVPPPSTSTAHQISRSLQNLKHGDAESTNGKRAGSADTATHRERETVAKKPPIKHRRCQSQSIVTPAAQHGLALPCAPHNYARSYSVTEQV